MTMNSKRGTNSSMMSRLKPFGLPPLHDPNHELASNRSLAMATSIDAECASPWTALKSRPEQSAETVSELLYGEPLQILERADGWLKIVSVIDGYVGWLLTGATMRGMGRPTHRINVPMSHIYREPNLKSEPLLPLPMASYVHINTPASVTNGFLPHENGGYIYAAHLSPLGAFSDDPVAIAERFIGTPYLWGGRTLIGMDCSALVQLSLSAAGHRVLRDSGSQFKSLGRPIEKDETPQRGDLAFFPGHVGWMVDSVHLLHANATHMAVTIDPVESVTKWVRSEGKKKPFSGFRRLA